MKNSTRLALPTALLALACLFGGRAEAKTMTADVNCRAWGARYDAPALLDRLLSKRPSQSHDLASRVCGKKVRSETMSILNTVPRAKVHARQPPVIETL